ncbi:CLUMA_CG019266, isoform A [Clunio marinus]|uniref:CLUMA_CG019266, isoform A n=1 Tax=Clunio marinus TaxID=568069 RepID=A0A1J1J3H1_9DIPT|nr:CLUMA_CG019266, isoform A [Clunio marinus]
MMFLETYNLGNSGSLHQQTFIYCHSNLDVDLLIQSAMKNKGKFKAGVDDLDFANFWKIGLIENEM